MHLSKLLLSSFIAVSSLFAAVNINTATKEELMSINGIGESKANAIIDYRKSNKFNSIDDIKNVKGIGDNIFKNIKDEISISGETSIAPKKTKAKTEKKAEDKKDEVKEKDNIKNKAKEVKDKSDK